MHEPGKMPQLQATYKSDEPMNKFNRKRKLSAKYQIKISSLFIPEAPKQHDDLECGQVQEDIHLVFPTTDLN